MKIHNGLFRILLLAIVLIILFGLVGADEPPNPPMILYGRVINENGDPISGVIVETYWKLSNGGIESSRMSTISPREALELGDSSLSGYYKFLNIDAPTGVIVNVVAGGKSIGVSAVPGGIVQAPDIIIKASETTGEVVEKEAFTDKIKEFTKSVLGIEDDSGEENSFDENTGNEDEEQVDQEETEKTEQDNESLSEEEKETQNAKEEKNKKDEDINAANESNYEFNERDFVYSGNNIAPLIGFIPSSILLCEGDKMDYEFNILHPDNGALNLSLSPEGLFYVSPNSTIAGKNLLIDLFSEQLKKEDIGVYNLTLIASDGELLDSRDFEIEVIEINNPPVFLNTGAKTLDLSIDKNFNYQVNYNDIEDRTLATDFKVEEDAPFTVGKTGSIRFAGDKNSVGVYNLDLCIEDKGIKNINKNISFCGQNGEPVKVCANFSITITEHNNKPKIVSSVPQEKVLSFEDGRVVNLTLFKEDFDGTFPDAYWYVDDILVSHDINQENSIFLYNYKCGGLRSHLVNAEITDGIENDSIQWEFLPRECSRVYLSPEKINKVKNFFIFSESKIFFILIIIIMLALLFFIYRKMIKILKIKKELELKQVNTNNVI